MNTIYSIYLQEPLLWIKLWIEYSFHAQCTIFIPILWIYQAQKILSSAREPHYRNVVLHNRTSSILSPHWPYTENNPPLILHYSKDTYISIRPLDIFLIVSLATYWTLLIISYSAWKKASKNISTFCDTFRHTIIIYRSYLNGLLKPCVVGMKRCR